MAKVTVTVTAEMATWVDGWWKPVVRQALVPETRDEQKLIRMSYQNGLYARLAGLLCEEEPYAQFDPEEEDWLLLQASPNVYLRRKLAEADRLAVGGWPSIGHHMVQNARADVAALEILDGEIYL